MAQQDDTGHGYQHKELQRTHVKKDAAVIDAAVEVLDNWMNPFEESKDLISLSIATAATEDITKDLLQAHKRGEEQFEKFKSERLESENPEVKFHDTIKRCNLKTFSSLSKTKKTRAGDKSIILQTDRSLFGRIILIAQSRKLQMEEVFEHPLGPLPWALATPDGLPRKSVKSVLARHLQQQVQPAENIPPNSATVVDGMAVVQRMRSNCKSFGDVAMAVHSMVLKQGVLSERIDVVFDVYKQNSIKNIERRMRGEEHGLVVPKITPGQLIMQWNKFLKQVNNKTGLIYFLASEWQKEEFRRKLNSKTMYVAYQERCIKITAEGTEEVQELFSPQEEADGRLLLHANHVATSGYSCVVIDSEDTDVFIMCVALCHHIPCQILQKCCTRTRVQLIDIQKIACVLGTDTSRALIGVHSLTGCDTVSSFMGKGKLRALRIVQSDKDMAHALSELGDSWAPSQELLKNMEKFVCKLYATKPATSDINQLRYHLFCAKRGEIESHQLPPCRDTLSKHVARANYQAAIWKKCLENVPAPDAAGNGWKYEGGHSKELVIDWMSGSPAPQAVLELLSCTCNRVCKHPSCNCIANGLKCTQMCKLSTCSNQASVEDDSSEDELNVEEDDNSSDDDSD